MIRREFLLTAGITVAAMSIMGPAVWADGTEAPDARRSGESIPASGWMRGYAGGCATAVVTEPPLPIWVTA